MNRNSFRRFAVLLIAVLFGSSLALAGAPTAQAAYSASATAPGASFRGKVYYGNSKVSISGVLQDTHRSNGHKAELHVRAQTVRWGSNKVRTAQYGVPSWTWTSARAGGGVTNHSVKKVRMQYRVCSHTHCSSWQTTAWRY
ncbi:hypothetical protein ACQBAU_17745 [Propionibacteriaceae bacterium Y2011]